MTVFVYVLDYINIEMQYYTQFAIQHSDLSLMVSLVKKLWLIHLKNAYQ